MGKKGGQSGKGEMTHNKGGADSGKLALHVGHSVPERLRE